MKPNLKRLTIVLITVFVGMVEVASAFYDPGLQRWVNRDPIGEAGGMNLHGYVANAPFSFVDPYGLENWFTRLGDGIVGGFGYNAYHGSLEVGGTDYTDHGRPGAHTSPHHHITEYGPRYAPGGKESGPLPGPLP